MKGTILLIEDDQDMCDLLKVGLGRRGFKVSAYTSGHEGLAAIEQERPDILLADINLPDHSGLEICRESSATWPDTPVLVMTAFGSMDTAIAAMRAGAYDFITKPVDLDLLTLALERAANHRALQNTVKQLSQAAQQAKHFDDLLGESKIMQDLFAKLSKVAESDASVLITGESGSGKELTALALHRFSPRQDKPFVAVNCSAMPTALLESELFGHVKGAFTDAHTDRKGLFMEADGGTLFLDEIGEIPLQLQPKLLRALEQRSLRPVGGNRELPFDVRIISATNLDLEKAVANRDFREDLFYRLNVINIDIPPLRARGNDILLLAEKFITHYAAKHGKHVQGLSGTTAKRLLQYRWPGNVRELRNAMEHAVALTHHDRIIPENLPERISSPPGGELFPANLDPEVLVPLDDMIHRYIEFVLRLTDGNQTLAAKILDIDRKTLYRRLQKLQ